MKKWLAVFAIACMFVGMPSQSDAQVGVRVGLSSMTGLVGIEYRTGNISLGAGPLAGPTPRWSPPAGPMSGSRNTKTSPGFKRTTCSARFTGA